MITPAHIEHFKSIASGVRDKATFSVKQEIAATKSACLLHGFSSRTALEIDSKIASALAACAQNLFEVQMDLASHAETNAQCATLQQTLLDEIQSVGIQLVALSESEAGSIMASLGNTWSPVESTASLKNALAEFPSKLYLTAAAHVNARQKQTASSTTINFNAPNALFQQGDNNIANVQQQSCAPSQENVLAAIDKLLHTLRGQPNNQEAAQIAEVLNLLKAEAAKAKPNKFSVPGLIAGVKDAIEMVKAAPDAWAVLQDWGRIVQCVPD